MSGNATGIVIDEILKPVRSRRGDPACRLSSVAAAPTSRSRRRRPISAADAGVTTSAGSMKVAANQQFLGNQVHAVDAADLGDAANPLTTGTLTGVTPSRTTRIPVTPTLGSGVTVNLTKDMVTGWRSHRGVHERGCGARAENAVPDDEAGADPDQDRDRERDIRDHLRCDHPHGGRMSATRSQGHPQPQADRRRVRRMTSRSTGRCRPGSARRASARPLFK